MSLGLQGGAKLNELQGLWGPYVAGKLGELARHARAYAEHHGVEAAFGSQRTQAGWRISFHPAAPDILLTAYKGYVVLTADTSQAGPGYHAFVVGFVDFLSRNHRWVWEFRNAARSFADDTGYYHRRDFAALQAAMAQECAMACQAALKGGTDGEAPRPVALNLPFNAADGQIATCLGFRDRAFFEQPNPERVFPWWEEGLTAQTLKNLALCKMWLDMSWQPPVTDGERRDLANCQTLIDLARGKGAEFADNEDTGDIAALLRGEPLDCDAAAGRIGYWRQEVRYYDPTGWSVALPAFYREEIDDDGQLCSLLWGDRAVYIRSGRFATALTGPEWPEPKWNGFIEYLRFETEAYRVVVHSDVGVDEDETQSWWFWRAEYCARDGSALINVASRTRDDAAWAEKVLRSVQPTFDQVE